MIKIDRLDERVIISNKWYQNIYLYYQFGDLIKLKVGYLVPLLRVYEKKSITWSINQSTYNSLQKEDNK